MINRKLLGLALTIGLAAGSGVACSNTREGVERDADRAAADAREAGRDTAAAADRAADDAERRANELGRDTREGVNEMGREAREGTSGIGNATDAAQQTMDIKTAFLADDEISGMAIDVDTDAATRTVTLSGSVVSQELKAKAERIAIGKAPGYTIKNNLTVGGKKR